MLDAGPAGQRGDAVAGSLLGMKISPGGGFSEDREGRGLGRVDRAASSWAWVWIEVVFLGPSFDIR